MKRVLLMIGLIFSLSEFAAPVLAAPVLDFGTGFAGSGGSVTYDPATKNVIGTGIPLDVLIVAGANNNNGVWDLSGGFVGGFGGSAALLNFDTNSGNITVTGAIPTLGINQNIDLLTGTIVGWDVIQSENTLRISEMTGSDVKHELLLAALGLDSLTPFTFVGFNISSKEGEAGPYVAFSTDILNTPVPIPPAILLLGGGLAGLAVIKRRLRV